MMVHLMCAMCICAIFFAGALFETSPEASVVIVALAAGFLGIFYAMVHEDANADEDDQEGDYFGPEW